MPAVTEDRTPSRREARRLVGSAGVFWAMWGCAVVSIEIGTAGIVIFAFGLIGVLSIALFYATFFRIWGQPFLFPSFRDAGLRWRIMMKLLSPRWLWRTVKATKWPSAFVEITLLALLAADLALFG